MRQDDDIHSLSELDYCIRYGTIRQCRRMIEQVGHQVFRDALQRRINTLTTNTDSSSGLRVERDA